MIPVLTHLVWTVNHEDDILYINALKWLALMQLKLLIAINSW